MKYLFTLFSLLMAALSFSQNIVDDPALKKNKFKYIEPKFHFGSFVNLKDDLHNSGLLDNGYGGITIKLGWQSNNTNGWVSRYGYPSYGVGFYSGFLSDVEVFGNPNALFGFIKFPVSNSSRRNEFSIEPSLGIAYNLNPYHPETNPVNTAFGARAAVYFNLDLGFAYKWTREMDLLYGFDFTHFSNGSVYQPNSGLNLYGLNIGLRYNYNAMQSSAKNDIYGNDVLPARFKRPRSKSANRDAGNAIGIYLAGGVAQSVEMTESTILMGIFAAVIDYEHQFNEQHAITGGVDFFYDSRLHDWKTTDRWLKGMHIGYDFKFYRFDVKMQIGKYLGDDKGKGAFFIRPAIRYNFSKRFFTQIGFKTLDRGAADFLEAGFGVKPFLW